MSEFNSDITVIGGGISGLWITKNLLDRGYAVNLVEKSPALASGATTRNEGWLHAGTYHSAVIEDEIEARAVTGRTIYGHNSIVDFAPESIDHEKTFALINTDELAHTALRRWADLGVQAREVATKGNFLNEGLDTSRIHAAFEVADKSVNSYTLCKKLARYILEHGGKILTGASLKPTSKSSADLLIGDSRHNIHSDVFVVSSGVGIKDFFESYTQKKFPMRYFKSHLLVTPRITEDNYFYLDSREAGVMSHGKRSVVGINQEAVEVLHPDYQTIPATEKLIYDALGNMIPRAINTPLGSTEIQGIACVKPDIRTSPIPENASRTQRWQDLNIKVFEPAEGYVCAVPGKMTEAPALARAVVDYVEQSGTVCRSHSLKDGIDITDSDIPQISERPLDKY